jgi:hypothetical protein
VDQSIAVESTLSNAWNRSRIGSFLSQPVSWVFLIVGGIIGFLSLYPTFFLFYGSLTDAPLGLPGNFTLSFGGLWCRLLSDFPESIDPDDAARSDGGLDHSGDYFYARV